MTLTSYYKAINEYIARQEVTLAVGAGTMVIPHLLLGATPTEYPFLLASNDGTEAELEAGQPKEKTTGEVIEVTGLHEAGVWNIARGKEGTSAAEHHAGTLWASEVTAEIIKQLQTILKEAEEGKLFPLNAGIPGGVNLLLGTSVSDTSQILSHTGGAGIKVLGGVLELLGTVHYTGTLLGLSKVEAKTVKATEVIEGPGLVLNGGAVLAPGSPAEVTANEAAWPLGAVARQWYRVKSNAVHEIQGIEYPGAQQNGQWITLTNIGTHPLVLVHLSASAESENQIFVPGEVNLVLEPGQSVDLRYDQLQPYWRVTDISTINGGVQRLPSSPAEITANQTAYNLGGTMREFYRIKSNASHNLAGIEYPGGQQNGQEVTLVNIGTHPIVLLHQSGEASAANRLFLPGEVSYTLEPNQRVDLRYDTASGYWRVMLPLAISPWTAVEGLSEKVADRGAPFESFRVRLEGQRAYLRGGLEVAAGKTLETGNVIFTLPEAFRPKGKKEYVIFSPSATVRLEILTTGEAIYRGESLAAANVIKGFESLNWNVT